jgi:mannose-1-phosphate guanylyltransferase
VGEPTGRDTAACIGLAAEICLKDDPDAQMVVLAADHLIQPTEAFHAAVSAASQYVSTRPTSLVTFGIPPVHPATGYGYLRRSDLAGTFEGVRVFKLRRFHEKPALDKAREFVASGEYFWNSGIFVWKTQTILEQLQEHVPTIRAAVGRIGQAWGTADQQSTLEAEYSEILKKSIDHAVMEHAPEVAMVETGFAWDDVGSWLALERTEKPSADGNTVIGTHLGIKSTNCVIVGDGKHVIATIGVDDLIVVHTPDATLVARRSDEQAVKELQQLLADRGLMDFA